VPDNLHPSIKWSAQHPNPLEAEVQDIPWQIVNQKEILNSNLNNSIFKAPNYFITAKGSMPIQFKITSTKHKADNQCELHTIKRLKSLPNSNNNMSEKENEKKNLMNQIKNRNSQHLVKMMHYLAANGMEITTVVHMPIYKFVQYMGVKAQEVEENIQRFQSVSVYTT
jgi:hypothetical protein